VRYIVFYTPETDDLYPGRIDSIDEFADGTIDADIDTAAPAGTVWIEGDADPTKDYVSGGAVVERPSLGANEVYHVDADGVENTLFTVPDPTVVTYRGTEYIAGSVYWSIDGDDGGYILATGTDYLVFGGSSDLNFIFASDISGEFEYDITPDWPYLPMKVTVIADAV
jgi:hypothetical protein